MSDRKADQQREFFERAVVALRSTPGDLRLLGLTVAVHNDYRLNGSAHTFWLLTGETEDGIVRAFKGEGPTDAAALDQIRAQVAKLTDNYHHAPLCPANHYHGKRVPSGPCSCGAVEANVTMKTVPVRVRFKVSPSASSASPAATRNEVGR